MLINADVLHNLLEQHTIIDLRSKQEYDTAHILGAVSLPASINTDGAPFKTTAGLPEEALWAAWLGGCGIASDTKIVAYDDGASGRAAARFWYIAKHYGHGDVLILNGGFPAASGVLPISADIPGITPAIYTTKVTPGYILDLDGVLENYDTATFLDVRSMEEYVGTDMRGNPRGGHVRGAKLVTMENFFADAPGQSFATPEKLAQTMGSLGVRKSDFIVTY